MEEFVEGLVEGLVENLVVGLDEGFFCLFDVCLKVYACR